MSRPDYIQASLLSIAALMVAFLLFAAGYSMGHVDPWSQGSFPCAEDEVLGYSPQFGPDRVGCIHVEVP